MPTKKNTSSETKETKKRMPGRTVLSREEQLASLTYDLAEAQLLDGTASSQVMTHFLKVGASSHALEMEHLKAEIELLKGKLESLKRTDNLEQMYKDAVRATQVYSGQVKRKKDES